MLSRLALLANLTCGYVGDLTSGSCLTWFRITPVGAPLLVQIG
jgi:hypothetical protein